MYSLSSSLSAPAETLNCRGVFPVIFFENFGKIALIVEADASGDLQKVHVRLREQLYALLDAQAVEIVRKADAELLFEELG